MKKILYLTLLTLFFAAEKSLGQCVTITPSASGICVGGSVTLTGIDSGTGTVTWSSSPAGTFTSVNSLVTDWTPTAGVDTYTITLTTTSTSCGAKTATVEITVAAIPTWDTYTAPASEICLGGTVSFSATVTGGAAGGSVRWVRSATSGGAGTIVTSGDEPPSTGDYYYRPQYVTTASGCSLSDGTETYVKVVAVPVWDTYTAPASEICLGGTVSFSATVTGGAAGGSVRWVRSTASGGAGTIVTSGDEPPSTGDYYYRPQYVTAASGCSLSDGTETYVKVVAVPAWNTYTAPASEICLGGTVSFSATVTGGAAGGSVRWVRSATSGGAGTIVTSGDEPPSTGDYYYRPQYVTTTTGCSISDGTETHVTVVADPSWNASSYTFPITSVCQGETVSFGVSINDGLGGTLQWIRSATSGGAGVTISSPDEPSLAGTYYFRPHYIATGSGCESPSDGTETTVTINTIPSLTSAALKTPVCSGSKATINLSGVINGDGCEIEYTINSASYTTSVVHVGADYYIETESLEPLSNGKYLHISEIRNPITGCSSLCSVSDVLLLVNTSSIPVIIPDYATPCVNTTGNKYTTDAGMTDYVWSWSGGGTETSGTVDDNSITMTWNSAVASWVRVEYRNLNGCLSTNTLNFTVADIPTPTFTGPLSVCDESEGNVYTTQTGKFDYDWVVPPAVGTVTSGGDGSNIVVVKWTVAGTHNISVNYENEAGCSATLPFSQSVSVHPIPSLSSSLTPGSICSGDEFIYTPTSIPTGSAFSWTRSQLPGITPLTSSGADGISETLYNNTTAPINVTYSYIVTADGCSSQPQNVTVTVNPIPHLSSSLSPNPLCSGVVFNYSPVSLTPSASFDWAMTPPGGITGSVGSGSGNISETLISSNTSSSTVTYVYTTSANGCSNNENVNLVVKPAPVLSTSLTPGPICSGTAFSYSAESSTASTAFQWSRLTVSGIQPNGNTGLGNVNEVLTNTTASPLNAVYDYTLSAGGCSNTQNVTVTVNPRPVPSVTGTVDVLVPSMHEYSTVAGMTGYTWNISAGGTIVTTPDPNIINVNWTTPGDKTVSLDYTNSYSCNALTPTSYNVHVNAKPVASQIVFTGQARSGMTLNASYTYSDVENNSEGSSIYQWYTGTSSGGAGSLAITGATGQLYTISDDDIGKYIGFSVVPMAVSGSTPGDMYTSITWVGPVINAAPVATISDITGSLDVGGVLSGHYVYTDYENDTESGSIHKWYSASSATGTYSEIGTGISHVITMAEQGRYFKYGVTAKALTGTDSSVELLSDPYGPVNTKPTATITKFEGTAQIGSTLSAEYEHHDVDGSAEGTSTYRWLRNGTIPIPGATGTTYSLTDGDEGYTITFEVTPVSVSGYPNIGDPVISTPTSAVVDPSPLNPEAFDVCIEGIRKVDAILRGKYRYVYTKSEGVSEYQWKRGGTIIGNSITYTLTGADIMSNEDITFSVTPRSSNIPAKEGVKVVSNPLARILLPKDEFSIVEGEITLMTNESVPAGVFSGPGVTNGKFSPKIAGAGATPTEHIIKYILNIVGTSHICSQNISDTVIVNPNQAIFTGFKSFYCHDEGPSEISVSQVPIGATDRKFETTETASIISSNETSFVFDPGKMNPGVGKDSLFYSYKSEGIFYKIKQAFTIDYVGTVNIINLDSSYCEGATKEYISVEGVYPPNGTAYWTGDLLSPINASSANADPALGVPGNYYQYSYSYKSPLGCPSNKISGRIKVNGLPNAHFSLNETYNYDAGPITLIPDQPGGTFTGDGVLGTTLFPDRAGTNQPYIKYEITDDNGCTASHNDGTIIRKAQGSIDGIPVGICYDNTTYTITISGLPTMGTNNYNLTNSKNTIVYTPGTITAQYSVPLAGAGKDTLTFSYSWDGVSYSISKNIEIVKLESIDIKLINATDPICTHQGLIELTTTKNGGTFTSGPLTGGFLDPVKAERLDTIVYEYRFTIENTNTVCKTISKLPIRVFPSPLVNFTPVDTCINGDSDSIVFNNLTTSNGRIESWLWKFTDGGSTHEIRDSVGSWLYKSGGLQKISLTATTVDGCFVTREHTYNIGKKPEADFYWKNDCMHEGDSIILVDNSVFTTPIISRSWKEIGGNNFGTSGVAKHVKDNTGYLNVEFTVNTAYANCSSSITKSIYIRPTFSADDYFEDFDDGTGGWTKDDSGVNTWSFGTPDREVINNAYSGINAWFTGFPSDSQSESSAVESPCFDFSNSIRPVIELNMFKRFEKDKDGAVLQYKTSDSNEWQNVGTINDGIEWYNSASISGEPGDVRVGWTTAGNPDANWKKSVHTLDELSGKTDVKFRIAYGSNGSFFDHDGMAFDDIYIGERGRKILVEHFTNSSDYDSKAADELINIISENKKQDLINIQYHTNFPGADPFYARNPGDVSARIFFYGLINTPYTFIDGGTKINFASIFDNDIAKIDSNEMTRRTLVPSPFRMTLETTLSGDLLNIRGKIIPTQEIKDKKLALFIAITEKQNSIGDTRYVNIFRKFLPDAGGMILQNLMVKGDTIEFPEQSWMIKDVSSESDLEVIAFIQDVNTREIYQAVSSVESEIVVGTDDIRNDNFRSFSVYPNPASDNLTVRFDEELKTNTLIRIFNLNGELIRTYNTGSGISSYPIDDIGLKGGFYIMRVKSGKRDMGFLKFVITED
ncbi:MAG TPA: T9SS type A sorting domain-containing protein [Bacteroidales bacterium]|nr:T9SS type A sorting domain-containing protein [Bacteroidales bacterium]